VLRVQSYLVTALLLISAGAAAQQSESASADEARSASAPYEPKVWAREMSGSFGGEQVDYTATAGETVLYDDEGKPKASIFSIAYVREGVDDAAARPVTFLFNGGPGSASLWLHMGAFGPKRVVLPSDARDDGAPPYTLVDNPEAPLDVTDEAPEGVRFGDRGADELEILEIEGAQIERDHGAGDGAGDDVAAPAPEDREKLSERAAAHHVGNDVDSNPGQGTSFTLKLPLHEGQTAL